MNQYLLKGQTLRFAENPFSGDPASACVHERRGAVVIEDGTVLANGNADALEREYSDAKTIDYKNSLILPGFIDSHVHYPQTAIIASWGKRLIEWLNGYTFPEETRFADADHAAETAARFFDLNIQNGITTCCSYCTIHPQSVDAYMTEARARGMRVAGGKVMMDRNAPDALRDTAEQSYSDSKALLEKWHGVDRLEYVVTPRFAPTSTPAQLEAAGALWAEHPECLMQTHLSEQKEEIQWVGELFPDAPDYFGVYEKYRLVGPGAVMGHSIHLTEREWARIAETGTAIGHCPTSNTFIGSGLFNMKRAQGLGIPVGLATDVGGGSSFSMLRTMAAAYEIGQLGGTAIHPAQLLWLATEGSARALRMDRKIGRLDPGMEADIVVLDLKSTPVIEQRVDRARDVWEAVFPTIMLGDDRAIEAVWINGIPA